MSEYTGFSTDYPTPEDEVVVLRMELERLRELVRRGCDGSSACESEYHWHGCYRDFGTTCEAPEEHK